MSEEDEVQNLLSRKSSEYVVDNLIKVTDRNRKRILQELIENPLKEEKKDQHACHLKIYTSEGYEKIIPLAKETPNVLPPIKFSYYMQTKKPRRNRLL